MKILNSFFSRTALAVLLVFGLAVAGCKKAPVTDNGNDNPGGTDTGDTDYSNVLSMEVSGIDMNTAIFNGILLDREVLVDLEEGGEIGVSYTEASGYSKETEGPRPVIKKGVSTDKIDQSTGVFSISVSELTKGTTYYYSAYIKIDGTYYYTEDEKSFKTLEDNPYEKPSVLDLSSAIDLSGSESSNCYVITSEDCKDKKVFKFAAVKGNDKGQQLSGVASATILWESAGNYMKTDKCSIIKGFCYKEGYVGFELPSSYKSGNAALAVKDTGGNILWSWHIWLPGEFKEQVYPNNAGIMMDRNLGATSDRGDGDCGLLYQWGRKDPFLGYSGAQQGMAVESSVSWPGAVYSTLERGTIDWAVAHPMTFLALSNFYDENLKKRTGNLDWLYNPASANGSTEAMIGRERWGSEKTIYDPCPAGWKVPNGGKEGFWNTAGFKITKLTRITAAITHPLTGSEIAYYPAAGSRSGSDGTLSDKVGGKGSYWTAHTSVVYNPTYTTTALYFVFNFQDWPVGTITEGANGETANFSTYKGRFNPAEGMSIRCVKIQ